MNTANKSNRIAHLQDLGTGENFPPHFIGTDERGRRLVQFAEGYQPITGDMRVVYPEQDADGNWIEGTECAPYTFE